jgi:branched-chain amino acid transport system permease protein
MQYVIAALATASVYALISMGITLIYGVARIMNVAHALMFLLSAFLTVELVHRHWPYLLATLASMAMVTVLGGVVYMVFFDRVRDRPYRSLVVSLGLVVMGEALLHSVWGVNIFHIEGLLSETRSVNGVSFTIGSVASVLVAVVLMGMLAVVLRHTASGRAMRAVAENPAVASLLGIRARQVSFAVFLGGTAMAALAGSLIGTFIPFSSASSDVFVLKAFAIAIVGGLGSPVGAVAASVLFAVAEIVPIAAGKAQWSVTALYLVMVVVLVTRPAGLFGRAGGPHSTANEGLPAPRHSPTTRWSTTRSLTLLVACIAILAALPEFTSSSSLHGLGSYAMGLAIVAYAVWIPLHFLGISSLAHAALCGVGAYAAAIEMQHWQASIWVQLGTSAACCAVVALALGLVSMRLASLPSVAIVTLALGGLVVSLLSNLVSVTGGVSGVTVLKPLVLGGRQYGPADSDLPTYWLGLGFIAVLMFGVWSFGRHRWGNTLLAIRDNSSLAESVGFNTYRLKVIVFTASGLLAGVSGVLYAYFSRFLEPGTFDSSLAINLLLAVLLGGVGSLYGPLIGVSIFVFLPYVSPLSGDASLVLYGAVLVAVASLAPAGIAGWFDFGAWQALARELRNRPTLSASAV